MKFPSLVKLFALPVAALIPLAAQDSGMTRQQADDILAELRQIRQLLERQGRAPQAPPAPEPTHAKLKLDGFQMLGSKNAPLTVVEFTDYQCPFCQRFHVTTFADLKKNYIDTGKVRFYSRDMPLDFHPNAMRAAIAARCAVEQGQFWALRDRMGANPDKLDLENILHFATDLKMDIPKFRGCIESEKYKDSIQADVLEASRIGANGTPTFVVGKSSPEGVDGELIVGALPYAVFDEKLKSAEAGK
jgi:protein-disulfide isomerase